MGGVKPIMMRFVLLANLVAQHLKTLSVSGGPASHFRQTLLDALDKGRLRSGEKNAGAGPLMMGNRLARLFVNYARKTQPLMERHIKQRITLVY
jgi:hypothetical protein